MIAIEEITPGKPYACKFRVKEARDEFDRKWPNLSDTPFHHYSWVESFGFLLQRDTEQQLVVVADEKTDQEFVCGYDDIWDVDDVEVVNE
jgi:hypothetical protein